MWLLGDGITGPFGLMADVNFGLSRRTPSGGFLIKENAKTRVGEKNEEDFTDGG
jgi:hypothetical protein